MTVLDDLARLIATTAPRRRVRVAVEGVDGSGKTTLADRLADALAPHRPVVRSSVDGFHRPRAERYRRGRDSPEGCYLDTFDLDALRTRLLEPFTADGSYVPAVFDLELDQPLDAAALTSPPDAVLLVDGVFLLRPELGDLWDLSVRLQVPDDEVLRRVVVRDPGDADDIARRYRTRYLPAQRLYEAQARPAERADVVLDNTDPDDPVVLRWPRIGA